MDGLDTGGERLLGRESGGPRLVLDADALRRVFGLRARGGGDGHHGLADPADPVDGQGQHGSRLHALVVEENASIGLAEPRGLLPRHDGHDTGRLARGLVSLGELVWAKVLLAALVALALGLGVSLVFGAIIQIGNVTGGEPWGRLPLLALGLLLAGAALGALGALLGAIAREARTASLVALLVVLPIVFLGLVPQEIVPAAGWISDGLPFIHAVRFFGAALYDASPLWSLLREALWLVFLGALFGFLGRIGTRRLLA